MPGKRLIAAAFWAALALVTPFSPAEAQDMGAAAKGLLSRALQRAAANTPAPEESDTSAQERRVPRADTAASPAPEAGLPAPPSVAPWPLNAGNSTVLRPGQLVFPAELVAEKQRYKDASTFSCSTCEGSIDFDVWRRSFSHPNESYSSWSRILEGWTVGSVIRWKGQAHDGTITVVGEVPVGRFPCRQLRHRMSTRGPNPVATKRSGLICLGRQDQYSGADTWHEVF